MQIKLKLHSKNWAIYEGGDPYVLNGDHVPRVGEIVDIGSEFRLAQGQPTTFIVCDVTWVNEKGELIPHLKCHQWYDGDRQLELEEHGWTSG